MEDKKLKWVLILVFLVLFIFVIKNANFDNIYSEEDKLTLARAEMVEKQLKARDITDEKVLEVMSKVERHRFISEDLIKNAYDDNPLPIGYGQTISQPYIVALMTQSLDLKPSDKVLEIGTGSGYQAAILAELVKEVYTVEIIDKLAKSASLRLEELGHDNIEVKNADGYFGWEEKAPFDKIIVTAGVNHVPPSLLKQLKEDGKLILPLGDTLRFQTLTLITKRGYTIETEFITSVRFVPLTGEALK